MKYLDFLDINESVQIVLMILYLAFIIIAIFVIIAILKIPAILRNSKAQTQLLSEIAKANGVSEGKIEDIVKNL